MEKMKKIIFLLAMVCIMQTVYGAIYINSCQTLSNANTEYIMTGDIENANIGSGSYCMYITGNNITLNCDNHKIDGIGSGHAIRVISSNIEIKNCEITDFEYGIHDYTTSQSDNITIYNCRVNTSNEFAHTWKGTEQNWKIYNNTYLANGYSVRVARQGFEIYHNDFSYGSKIELGSNDILIYDNIFNTTTYFIGAYIVKLNITEQEGTNIMGGYNIGGNFWAKPDGSGHSEQCSDIDYDGFCDNYYNTGFGIDYLPLSSYLYYPDSSYNFVLTFRDYDTGELLTDDLTYVCIYDENDSELVECSFSENGKIRRNWTIDNHIYTVDIQRTGYLDDSDSFVFDEKITKTYYLKSTNNGTFITGTVYDKDTGQKLDGYMWLDRYVYMDYHDVVQVDDGSYTVFVPSCDVYLVSPRIDNYHLEQEDSDAYYVDENGEMIYGKLWACSDETWNTNTTINFPMKKDKTWCNITFEIKFMDVNGNCVTNDIKADNLSVYMLGQKYGLFYNFFFNDSDLTEEVACDTYQIEFHHNDINIKEYKDIILVQDDMTYEACLEEWNYHNLSITVKNDSDVISGASVILFSDDEQYFYQTKITNSTGQVKFTDLLGQTYQLTVKKDGYKDYEKTIFLEKNTELTVILGLKSMLYGIVKDSEGNYLDDVEITIGNYTTKTDDGYYSVEIPNGNYILSAKKQGFYDYTENVTINGITKKDIIMTSFFDFVDFSCHIVTGDDCNIAMKSTILIQGITIDYMEYGQTDNNGYYEAVIGLPMGKYKISIKSIDGSKGKTFYENIYSDFYRAYCIPDDSQTDEDIEQETRELGRNIQAMINDYGLILAYLILVVIFMFFASILFEFFGKI